MIAIAILAQAGQYQQHNGISWLLLIQWILPLVYAIFAILFYILFAVCIWRAAKYFGSAVNEQKLLRLEMGKLAEEMHLLRQEMKGK
jgi:hypothetical protein